MRAVTIRFATIFGLFLFCSSASIQAQNSDDDEVFENCAWTLTQLTQFELDDNGKLVLKRDHWETAAKRPVDDPTQFTLNQRFANDEDRPPIEKLFNRLVIEAGSGGISTTSRNMEREIAWDGTYSEGSLLISETEMTISVIERKNENRRFHLRTLGDDIELTFLSPKGELLQLLQSAEAIRLCSVRSGEPTVISGATFAQMVHQHKEYFASIEYPPFIAELPITEALEMKVKETSKPVQFPPLQFTDAEFLKESHKPKYEVFARFRILDGRLQFNDFFGNASVLAKETETLSKEYGESLDRALLRLKEADAPAIQIGKIQARFGAWKASTVNDGAGAGKYFPLQDAFQELQTLAGNRSSSSSRGSSSFRQSFESDEISASLSRDGNSLSFRISNDPVNVDFSQDESGFVLTANDTQSVLMVREMADGSATLIFVHGDLCKVWKAKSWLELISEHETEFRQHVVPVLDHYAISGLDPFHPDVINTAMTSLKKDLPRNLDLEAIVGKTDSYIIPLLCNEKYLQLLTTKVAPDDAELVKARLRTISGK